MFDVGDLPVLTFGNCVLKTAKSRVLVDFEKETFKNVKT